MDYEKRYRFVKEHDKHLELHDTKDKKNFNISKKEIHPATQLKIHKLQKFDDGGEVEGFDSGIKPWAKEEVAPQSSWLPSDEELYGPKTTPAPSSDMVQTPVPDQASPAQQAPVAQDQPSAPMAAQSPSSSAPVSLDPAQMVRQPGVTSGDVRSLENQYDQSIQREAQGQINQNQQMAKAYEPYLAIEQKRMETFQQSMQVQQAQLDKLSQDISSSKIDPKKFWNDKSTGAKVGTSLAVLLSGIGQGLSGSTHNMAQDVLQQGIDRDIESQKANLGKKQTMLSDNLRIQGNLMAAEQATRLQASALIQGQLAKIAAQSGDPMIAERAKQKMIEFKHADIPLMQSVAQNESSMAIKKQLMQGNVQGHDPASYVPYVVPEPRQKEVFEEIKNAQNIKSLAPKIMDAFQRGSSRNPVTAAQGKREFEGLMNTTVQEQEGTARQAAFDSIHDKMSPGGTTALPGENEAKARTTLEYLAAKGSAPTAKGFGIDLSKFDSTSTMKGAHPHEGKTATNDAGQKIVMQNGKWVPVGR